MKMNISQEAKDISFLVLYGSQLGQAKSIAENINSSSAEFGLSSKVFPLNDVSEVSDIANLDCPLVIITSTTGEGEPPENADKFWRKIRRRILKPPILSKLSYTLLGLGDTNFNTFCNCGKVINSRLLELGAKHFYDPEWIDDAIGQDDKIEIWIEDLWTILLNHCKITSDPDLVLLNKSQVPSLIKTQDIVDGKMEKKSIQGLPALPPSSLILEYPESFSETLSFDPMKPPMDYPLIEGDLQRVKVTNARILTKPGALKTTLELTMEFEKEGFEFEPGDAIGIVCKNSSFEVDMLLDRLQMKDRADAAFEITLKEGSKGKIPPFFPFRTNLRTCLTHFCDIRQALKKGFVRLLAESCTDENEKDCLLELCSRGRATSFNEKFREYNHSLLDILLEYPSCSPKVQDLLEHLPRLIPRAYSISSSPLSSANSFKIAFNIISFPQSDGRKYARNGICTGFLASLAKDLIEKEVKDLSDLIGNLNLNPGEDAFKQDNQLIVYKRKNHYFRLPQTEDPIIMVGPGTGIAPFIGFIEHRALGGESKGQLQLYFGCRNKELDFLFEEDLNSFLERKILTHLFTSFSRDSNNNGIKYVQDQMENNKEILVKSLLDDKGYFYVCGDAKNMAKNVREKLLECIQNVKGISPEEAKKQVESLVKEKRYLQDVWI